MNDLVTLGIAWIAGGVITFAVGAAVWFVRERTSHAEGGEITPLNDLLAEDQSATDMWDSFEEADVHGIEVDDTAAEADMVPYSVIAANGPAVLAQGRALVAGLEAWRRHTDMEAWLGERGWL